MALKINHALDAAVSRMIPTTDSSSDDTTYTREQIAASKWRFLAIADEEVHGKYDIDDANRDTVNDLWAWCMMAPDSRYNPDKGLWIYGNIGTGKSTLLRIIKRFCQECRPHAGNGFPYSFRITQAKELTRLFNAGGYAALNEFEETPHQAFDDVGLENPSTSNYGMLENVVAHVLLKRYDNRWGDFTHVTTNLSLDQIKSIYGARVFDRCREMFNFVPLCGRTRRKE